MTPFFKWMEIGTVGDLAILAMLSAFALFGARLVIWLGRPRLI